MKPPLGPGYSNGFAVFMAKGARGDSVGVAAAPPRSQHPALQGLIRRIRLIKVLVH